MEEQYNISKWNLKRFKPKENKNYTHTHTHTHMSHLKTFLLKQCPPLKQILLDIIKFINSILHKI
jgi:hypothetical protein